MELHDDDSHLSMDIFAHCLLRTIIRTSLRLSSFHRLSACSIYFGVEVNPQCISRRDRGCLAEPLSSDRLLPAAWAAAASRTIFAVGADELSSVVEVKRSVRPFNLALRVMNIGDEHKLFKAGKLPTFDK